jgi:hypothetical protein
VRGPHCGSKKQPSHHYHQTKIARSQLEHLQFVPLIPDSKLRIADPSFPVYLDACCVAHLFRCTTPASHPHGPVTLPTPLILRELDRFGQ